MRRWLIAITATMLAIVAVAVGIDFGAAIYAEYRLSRTLRADADLSWDPAVAVLGFPFSTQAMRESYDEIEIKATGVEHPLIGRVALETTMHSVDLWQASWLIRPDAPLPVGKLESRIIIDSRHLGRFMGIDDLMIEAPRKDTNDPTGGTTESGISGSSGLVFTGTATAAGFDERVSVAVDLSMTGPQKTTLVLTATEVTTGPGTADQEVPDTVEAAVLALFSKELPEQTLPFGLRPTTQGVRGTDIIIEGITEGVTVTLDGFTTGVSEPQGTSEP
ncbi:MAG: mannan chain length control protein LmeA [Mycobacterium sp.]